MGIWWCWRLVGTRVLSPPTFGSNWYLAASSIVGTGRQRYADRLAVSMALLRELLCGGCMASNGKRVFLLFLHSLYDEVFSSGNFVSYARLAYDASSAPARAFSLRGGQLRRVGAIRFVQPALGPY